MVVGGKTRLSSSSHSPHVSPPPRSLVTPFLTPSDPPSPRSGGTSRTPSAVDTRYTRPTPRRIPVSRRPSDPCLDLSTVPVPVPLISRTSRWGMVSPVSPLSGSSGPTDPFPLETGDSSVPGCSTAPGGRGTKERPDGPRDSCPVDRYVDHRPGGTFPCLGTEKTSVLSNSRGRRGLVPLPSEDPVGATRFFPLVLFTFEKSGLDGWFRPLHVSQRTLSRHTSTPTCPIVDHRVDEVDDGGLPTVWTGDPTRSVGWNEPGGVFCLGSKGTKGVPRWESGLSLDRYGGGGTVEVRGR